METIKKIIIFSTIALFTSCAFVLGQMQTAADRFTKSIQEYQDAQRR